MSDNAGNSGSYVGHGCNPTAFFSGFYVDNGAIPPPFPTAICNGTQDGSSGPADGGNTVTIRGVDFKSGATVTFGATPATSVAFVSSKELTVVVPRSTQQNVSVDVTVKNPDNQARKIQSQYQYDPFATTPVPATITASPNPVPVGQTITTITWNTGDSSVGTVCVSDNGGAQTIFDGSNTSHSQIAPFINSGSYVFALHSGAECTGATLASVTVTFDSGDGSVVQVMLSVNGDQERLFTQSQFGSVTAPWIFSGVYTFRIVKAGATIGRIVVGTTA